jgi:RNA polymerase sigma-70 factor, ECF subfamily
VFAAAASFLSVFVPWIKKIFPDFRERIRPARVSTGASEDPLVSQTDRQIASSAAAGDLSAFVQMVERYRAPLIGYVYGLTGVRDDAEELAQEAFCRVWHKLPSLRQRESLVSWLYRIAHNLAVTQGRRPRLKALTADPPDETQEARTDSSAAVHRAVAELPEVYRVAVSLRHFAGLSHEEIAEALSIPAGTVRSRLSRAYERLRPQLAHLLEE